MKKEVEIYKHFQPKRYELGSDFVKITGQKLPPPSKRITLHQKGLKVTGAKIIRHDKKGDQEFEVVRINHLPTMRQARLHTKETLFPGHYEITVFFGGDPKTTLDWLNQSQQD